MIGKCNTGGGENLTTQLNNQDAIITELEAKVQSVSGVDMATPVNAQTVTIEDIQEALVDKGAVNKVELTVTPGKDSQEYNPDYGTLYSKVIVNGDADLIAGNIKEGVNIFNVIGTMAPNYGAYVWKKYEIISCFSFIGNKEFTLKTYNTSKNWDGTLEYSTNATTWNTWDGTEISSSGNNLYLRGIGNTRITGNDSNCRFVFTGTSNLKIACEGNIENLLDYEMVSAGGHPTMAENCYYGMFDNCTSLTTAPALPATTLANYCYQSMFRDCTALTTAPELPATTLADYCYNGMFQNCTSLTTVSTLPATTLAEGCYSGMFYSCTKIKLSTTQTGEYQTAYRIPTSGTGTTATSALNNMFSGTGGTFKGTPSINTTYYLSTSNTVV